MTFSARSALSRSLCNTAPGVLVPVEGVINSKAYLPIIERKVSRKLSKLHPQAIFQQDSAPCHKAKIIG